MLDHSGVPMDGQTLSDSLHTRGINIRYLGKIATMLGSVKSLDYLYSTAVLELITRGAKHLFTTYIQNTDMMYLSGAISHFLNCFLSSCQLPHPQQTTDEVRYKSQYCVKFFNSLGLSIKLFNQNIFLFIYFLLNFILLQI